MKYAIVTIPAAPVRKEANHRAEMSNQLLFGEAVRILKIKQQKWLKVESLYDGYKGWLTNHLVTAVPKEIATMPVSQLASGLISNIKVNGASMNIPAGSSLIGLRKGHGGFGDFKYEFSGEVIEPAKIKSKAETMVEYAHTWRNAPYLWGGKTILGVDCSGFAQTIYKLVGIPVPRDAWQQAQQGKAIKKLGNAQPGDLAFFDDKDEIVHVGILLGPDKIIHSAGKVRIDPIDKKGIVNCDTGMRTHSLSMIKRFL